jgi:hypothetical protein
MWFSVEALVLKHGNVEIGGSTRSLLAASVKVDGVEKKNLREQTELRAFIGEPRQSRLSGPFLRAGPKIFAIQLLGIGRGTCKNLLAARCAGVKKMAVRRRVCASAAALVAGRSRSVLAIPASMPYGSMNGRLAVQ